MRKKSTYDGRANLKPCTPENARERQKLGVIQRKKNIEARKKMSETLDILLKKTSRKGKVASAEDIENMAEAEGLNVDTQTAIMLALVERAKLGDVQAIQFIRDTVGEKPSDKVELDQSKTIETWAKTHEIEL